MSYLITTGKSPDYVMRRGREILNYLCHLHFGESQSGREIIKTFSHRSLFVVAREVSQIASSHLGVDYHLRRPSNKTDRLEIQLNAVDRPKIILVELAIPAGLPEESQEHIGTVLYGFILNFRDLTF